MARVYLHKPSNLNAFVLLGIGVLASKNRLELCCIPISRVLPQEYFSPFPLPVVQDSNEPKKLLKLFLHLRRFGSSIGSLCQPNQVKHLFVGEIESSHPDTNDTKMWYTNHGF